MDIVDPAGSSAATARTLAVRPGSLEGVTIALLDNSKPNARALLERLGAPVAAKSGARAVRVWSKPGSSISAATSVLEEIASSSRHAVGDAEDRSRRLKKAHLRECGEGGGTRSTYVAIRAERRSHEARAE